MEKNFLNIFILIILFSSFIKCNFVNISDKINIENNLNKNIIINPNPNLYNLFSSTSLSNMAGAINNYFNSQKKEVNKNINKNLINYNNIIEEIELCIISTGIRASLKNFFIFKNKEYYIYYKYIIYDILVNLFVCISFLLLKYIKIKEHIRIIFFIISNFLYIKGKIIIIFLLKIIYKLIGYFIIKFICSKIIKYNKILRTTLYGFISVILDNYIEKIM